MKSYEKIRITKWNSKIIGCIRIGCKDKNDDESRIKNLEGHNDWVINIVWRSVG